MTDPGHCSLCGALLSANSSWQATASLFERRLWRVCERFCSLFHLFFFNFSLKHAFLPACIPSVFHFFLPSFLPASFLPLKLRLVEPSRVACLFICLWLGLVCFVCVCVCVCVCSLSVCVCVCVCVLFVCVCVCVCVLFVMCVCVLCFIKFSGPVLPFICVAVDECTLDSSREREDSSRSLPGALCMNRDN